MATYTNAQIASAVTDLLNAGGTQQDIAAGMDRLGITPAQLSAAIDMPLSEVQSIYNQVAPAGVYSTVSTSVPAYTDQQIANYVQTVLSSGGTQRDIAVAMDQAGVSPNRLANAINMPLAEVQSIYNQVAPVGAYSTATVSRPYTFSPAELQSAREFFGTNPTAEQIFSRAAQLKLNPEQTASIYSQLTGADYRSVLGSVNEYLNKNQQTLPGGYGLTSLGTSTRPFTFSSAELQAAREFFATNPTPDQIYARAEQLKLSPQQIASLYSQITGQNYDTLLGDINSYLTRTGKKLTGGYSLTPTPAPAPTPTPAPTPAPTPTPVPQGNMAVTGFQRPTYSTTTFTGRTEAGLPTAIATYATNPLLASPTRRTLLGGYGIGSFSPAELQSAKEFFSTNPTPDQIYQRAYDLKLSPAQVASLYTQTMGGNYDTTLRDVERYLSGTSSATPPTGLPTVIPSTGIAAPLPYAGVPAALPQPTVNVSPEGFAAQDIAELLAARGTAPPPTSTSTPVTTMKDGGLASLHSAAEELRQQGRGNDTILAHINPEEAGILKLLGGRGTINPQTGLPEFDWFSKNITRKLGKPLKQVAKTLPFVVPFIPGLNAFAPLISGIAGGFASGKGFDLKRGLMSGLTAYGIGQLAQGAGAAGSQLTPGPATTFEFSPGDAASAATSSTAAVTPPNVPQFKTALPTGSTIGDYAKATLGNVEAATRGAGQALIPGAEGSAARSMIGKSFSPGTAAATYTGVTGTAALDEAEKFKQQQLALENEEEERRKRFSGIAEEIMSRYPIRFAAAGGSMDIDDNIGYDFNAGGMSPRFLSGGGDGMSDSIPAVIGGKQPARLADGEFVIPADVVSGLGNGSSKAGAKQLYAMMDRIRKARTGTTKQGREINARRFMPA